MITLEYIYEEINDLCNELNGILVVEEDDTRLCRLVHYMKEALSGLHEDISCLNVYDGPGDNSSNCCFWHASGGGSCA